MSEGFVCIIVLWQSVDGESAEPIPSTDVILDQSSSFNAIFILFGVSGKPFNFEE